MSQIRVLCARFYHIYQQLYEKFKGQMLHRLKLGKNMQYAKNQQGGEGRESSGEK